MVPKKPIVFCIIKRKKTWRQITGPCSRMCEVISHLYLLNMSNVQDPCYTQGKNSSQSAVNQYNYQWHSMAISGKVPIWKTIGNSIERDNRELIMVFISYGSSGYMWPFQEPIYWRYLPYWISMAISGTDLLEVPTIYFLAYVLGLYYIISRNIPRKYCQKYGTIVPPCIGSWNSHWPHWWFRTVAPSSRSLAL